MKVNVSASWFGGASLVALGVVLGACATQQPAPDNNVPSAVDATPASNDACAAEGQPACQDAPTIREGKGLVAANRCAFSMSPGPSFAARIDGLAAMTRVVSIGDVLGDLNREATRTTTVAGSPAGVKQAFRWADDDNATHRWIPQGITGSADATQDGLVEGRRVLLVSSYFEPEGTEPESGVRIAFVDITDPARPRYRFVLLVEPTGTDTAPSFKAVNIHAGGVVWAGDRLLVADTSRGLRSFDMTKILKVAADRTEIGCAGGSCSAAGYAYVLPQRESFGITQGTCPMVFSWVSLDKSTSPPSVLTGEYCPGSVCADQAANGRIFRWSLGADNRLPGARAWPTEAFYMQQKQVQGAASRNGVFYFSSSAPSGGGGALYRVKADKSSSSKWSDAPEDLMIDESSPGGPLMWSLVEHDPRSVYGVSLSSYPAP